MKQAEFNVVLNALKKYSPKKSEYIKEKMDLLDNVKNFSCERDMIINAFNDKIFPLYHESKFEDKEQGEIRDENGLINYQNLDKLIFLKKKET